MKKVPQIKASVTQKKTSVLDKIKDIEVNDYVKMCIYGRGGTGKTTLSASFPKPLLLINIPTGLENGARSIKNVKGVKKIDLESSSDLRELFEYIQDNNPYQTVVIDHLTNLQELVLTELLGLKEMPVQKTWGLATRDQYGQCIIRVKEWIREAMGLPCNTVLIAQEREYTGEEDSEILDPCVGPSLFPSVYEWFDPSCDFIVQTFKRQKTKTQTVKVGGKSVSKEVKVQGADYCLRVGPDATYSTKFRISKGVELPHILTDVEYNDLLEYING